MILICWLKRKGTGKKSQNAVHLGVLEFGLAGRMYIPSIMFGARSHFLSAPKCSTIPRNINISPKRT